jgi:hypothetical protein
MASLSTSEQAATIGFKRGADALEGLESAFNKRPRVLAGIEIDSGITVNEGNIMDIDIKPAWRVNLFKISFAAFKLYKEPSLVTEQEVANLISSIMKLKEAKQLGNIILVGGRMTRDMVNSKSFYSGFHYLSLFWDTAICITDFTIGTEILDIVSGFLGPKPAILDLIRTLALIDKLTAMVVFDGEDNARLTNYKSATDLMEEWADVGNSPRFHYEILNGEVNLFLADDSIKSAFINTSLVLESGYASRRDTLHVFTSSCSSYRLV